MRRAGVRIVLLLGVLGVVLSGAPAGALTLTTTANVLTSPPTGDLTLNCSQGGAAGPTSCTTAAGTATAVAALWSLGGLASTQGTPGSALHQAAAVARFIEDVSAPGAPAGATLVATFALTGAITTAAGATGFVQLSFDAGATLLSASNGTLLSSRQAQWDFDQNSAAAFSETAVVQWALTGGSVAGLLADMSVSVNNTGFVLDFLNTLELDKLEAFDAGENPIVLDLFDPAGGLIGTTVPEPSTALLLLLPALLVAARRLRS